MSEFITINKISPVGAVLKSDVCKNERIAIARVTELIGLGFTDAFYVPAPVGNINEIYIIADPVTKTITVMTDQILSDNLIDARNSCRSSIKSAMTARLDQGIIWKYNNAGDPYPISLDDGMQKLFSYTATLRGKGRANSHAGNIRQGTVSFNINDAGLEELSIFAAEWGLAIQRVALDQMDALEAMDMAQLQAYDASLIDWTINWSTDPQNSGIGWNNDTVMQNP